RVRHRNHRQYRGSGGSPPSPEAGFSAGSTLGRTRKGDSRGRCRRDSELVGRPNDPTARQPSGRPGVVGSERHHLGRSGGSRALVVTIRSAASFAKKKGGWFVYRNTPNTRD